MLVSPPASPPKTLAAYKYSSLSANKTANQKIFKRIWYQWYVVVQVSVITKYRIAKIQKATFLPSNFVMTINTKSPKNPPRYDMDPSHDASSVVIGPVDSGELGDNNTRSEGDSQPMRPPYEIAHKLA